jgi:hypothetical protein
LAGYKHSYVYVSQNVYSGKGGLGIPMQQDPYIKIVCMTFREKQYV